MRIKGIITFLLLVSLCSCQDDKGNGLEMISVRIGAGIDSKDCLYSRANSQGDEEVTRCLVEIVMDGVSQGIQAMAGDETNGFTLNTTLYKGKTYALYFWADQGSDFYNATDLTVVSLVASQKPSIAYHGTHSFVPSDEENSFTETLTHAVAKVSYFTTTPLQSDKSVTMTLPRVYPTFNVAEGAASGSYSSRSYSLTLTESVASNSVVFSEYAFVDNEVQNVQLSYTYAPTVTVTNAPIATNVHTTLRGDISNQATIGVTASISSSWATEVEQGYEEDEEEEQEIGIDMGGTVLWAPCNLGAENPEDFGDYYQWGFLNICNTSDMTECNPPIHLDSYTLPLEYDAAAQNTPWRMPTVSECEELLSCTKTSATINDVNVYILTSNITNKELIFPEAGYYKNTNKSEKNVIWTSTYFNISNNYYNVNCLYLNELSIIKTSCYCALPIRPVKDKPTN